MKPHAGADAFVREWACQGFVFLALAILLGSLFRLQILGTEEWELRAESNRVRRMPVAVPRGDIVDRDGRMIATSTQGYSIVVVPTNLSDLESALRHIGTYVALPESEIRRHLEASRRHGNQPVVIDRDADFRTVSAIAERPDEFPRVVVETRPRRLYPAGRTVAHLTGYVGEISETELGSDGFPNDRYRSGMVVGKDGLERVYDMSLQGTQGFRYVEVDSRGRIVGEFASSRQAPGTSGEDLRLNIHLGLQEWIARIFPDTLTGAVVALDVEDGGVLALYSTPSYDPNDFVGGIDTELWGRLAGDSSNPLFNRAVLGRYAPASTWKLAVAAIGLDQDIVEVDEFMPTPCRGGMSFGGDYRRCWDPEGHGYNNMAQAIGNSCNVYFYQLGMRLGLDRLLDRANQIGFRDKCGIDLPRENEGVFPEGREFWERVFGYDAKENEVLSLAIGQGPNSQTPLKIAQFYLALARDGSAPPPTIAVGAELGEGWVLNLGEEELAAVREGLRRVTQPGGTAHYATALEHWQVLGKTGTGQNSLSIKGEAHDHAWFAGMGGPFDGPPEIVVVVMVEYGESGSETAAPIVAKAADYYLRTKHGIAVDTLQTYLDYTNAGVYPAWYWDRMSRAEQETGNRRP